MQRVFANVDKAKEALQAYADYYQTPCVVYCATYGPHRTPEYTIRPTADVIDLSSSCVIATAVHVPHRSVVRHIIDQPELITQ